MGDIRERHYLATQWTDGINPTRKFCSCGDPWPCDAIREADRADKAEAALAEAKWATHDRDAARAERDDAIASKAEVSEHFHRMLQERDAARADAKALAVKVGELTIQRNVLAARLAALMDHAVEVGLANDAVVYAMQFDDMTAARAALAAHEATE